MTNDTVFAGPVPVIYDRCLGPIMFQLYAEELAARIGPSDRDILETAAGTGIVTRAVAAAAPEATIVATDLNQAMLDVAAAAPPSGRVTYRQADAQALPFGDAAFDVVVSSFGVMFMPDKVAAYREARRVLRPGGRFLFTVWDRLDANPFSQIVEDAVAALFPDDPPRFVSRTPFGYNDRGRIERELRGAGFGSVAIEVVRRDSAVESAMQAATGLCQGTPLRGEIEARDPTGLARATEAAAARLRAQYGEGSFTAPVQALIVTAS